MRRIAIVVLLLVALGTARGAGDAPVSAGFTPVHAEPRVASVTMAEDSHGGDQVTIRVNAAGPASVFGAAFDVTYDSSGAEWLGWSRGTLLEQGGNAPNYTVAVPKNGTVVVGVSRTGASAAPASGQAIVSLKFRVRRRGTFPIAFHNAALYDSQNPPQPIREVAWVAGSITGA